MESERQRLDKWLWYARVTKSRTLAQKISRDGRVRINRIKTDSASHPVKVGDVLTVTLKSRILVVRILDLGKRRGPAVEAQTLYQDLSPASVPKPSRPVGPVRREPGSGRPTKKERRKIDEFRRGGPS